jgi:hypothetical protein
MRFNPPFIAIAITSATTVTSARAEPSASDAIADPP